MSEPKPKIKTVKQLEKELNFPAAAACDQKQLNRILEKIRNLRREQHKLT